MALLVRCTCLTISLLLLIILSTIQYIRTAAAAPTSATHGDTTTTTTGNNPPFNPYTILGVSRHSKQSEIRAAYKRLAMRYHPDKSDTHEDEQHFLDIQRSYEI